MPVYFTQKPDKPYSEVGLIHVRTESSGEDTRRAIQEAVLDMHAQAAIVTGNHDESEFSWLSITATTARPYTDAVAITWK